MRVIYEACDGKQFATAMACNNHEQELRNLIGSTLIDVMTTCKNADICDAACRYYDPNYGECRMDDRRPSEWDFGGIENIIKED